MGQLLSNIIKCIICGEADDEESPSETTLLISPATPVPPSPCKSTSNAALTQTLLTFSPGSDSCSDSSPSDGDSITIEVLIEQRVQNLLVSREWPDSHGDTPSNQEILLSNDSRSFASLDDSSSHSGLEQEVLISSPSFVSLSELSTNDSLNIPTMVDIEVVEEKTQISQPVSELNSQNSSEEDEERVDERVKKGVVGKERWIKHYSTSQKILLVGEGDFSFSASLAVAFGSATDMIATSLDSIGYLRKNYRHAMSNIQKLKSRGCLVMHGVDATEMADHLLLKGVTFDRIVFNFPLPGFFPTESRHSQLVRNRRLVGLFLENANKMVREKGEIHISHKSNGFFREWNLEFLASIHGLRLIEEVRFNFRDYPGYHTKYGFGGDNNFNCNPSKTYKFGLKNPH